MSAIHFESMEVRSDYKKGKFEVALLFNSEAEALEFAHAIKARSTLTPDEPQPVSASPEQPAFKPPEEQP